MYKMFTAEVKYATSGHALMSSTVILRLRCFLVAGLPAVPGAGVAALPPREDEFSGSEDCQCWC